MAGLHDVLGVQIIQTLGVVSAAMPDITCSFALNALQYPVEGVGVSGYTNYAEVRETALRLQASSAGPIAIGSLL